MFSPTFFFLLERNWYNGFLILPLFTQFPSNRQIYIIPLNYILFFFLALVYQFSIRVSRYLIWRAWLFYLVTKAYFAFRSCFWTVVEIKKKNLHYGLVLFPFFIAYVFPSVCFVLFFFYSPGIHTFSHILTFLIQIHSLLFWITEDIVTFLFRKNS